MIRKKKMCLLHLLLLADSHAVNKEKFFKSRSTYLLSLQKTVHVKIPIADRTHIIRS